MKVNENYKNLEDSYLFSTIARKVAEYGERNPSAKIIRLGIGDVTLPLAPVVIEAMQQALCEMSVQESFRGYGPEQGYSFLKDEIQEYYARRGTKLDADEIFISDGAKSDLGNILDLFDVDNTVLIPDPVYPVYVDTNVMAGRKIIFMDANVENGFLPLPDPSVKADIIYLCSPNNPTGAAYDRAGLKAWVDYANAQGAVILYDAAYECFIEDENLARSIYEIEGAKTCAIEFCSFSKMAGFTGTRCGYTVVPMALERGGMNLHKMWLRRQTTKFNGVPYVVQRGAAAVFTREGQKQIHETLAYYKENAKVLAQTLDELGIWYTGGKNSPYLWLECPNGMDSWTFFDYLLEKANVVGTPGAGFGKNGDRFFRLTAFGDKQKTLEAAERLKKLLAK
ncbi:MAG: LL-diaminopimelate aminotransferase [Butyricicoccus sp.]|nr:LL-diaminopimelate aminotransferase [Butyricicoccus sp.]